MKITINGTQSQVASFFKSLFSEEELATVVKLLAEQNLIALDGSSDNELIYAAINETRWETGFHLLHLLYTLPGEETKIGRSITHDELLNLQVGPNRTLTDREISSRFAGLSKIAKRLNSPELFKIRPGKEKRYIMPPEVVSTFEQYWNECLEDEDTIAEYQTELDAVGLSMPGSNGQTS